MTLELPDRFSKKIPSNTKFLENLCSGSLVVPGGGTNEQIYMTKLMVTFQNFPNASKKSNRVSTTVKSHSDFKSLIINFTDTK